MHAIAIHQGLLQINQAFEKFAQNLDSALSSINSHEMIREKMNQWRELIHQTKTLLARFPKEIRNREFVRSMLAELDQCDGTLNNFRQSVKELKINGRDTALNFFKQARSEAAHLSVRLRTLRTHPLILKFIEGKKILASRKHLQWGRKIFHTFNGLLGMWIYNFSGLTKGQTIGVLLFFISIAVATEIGKRASPSFNDWVCRTLSGIMRERERHGISSATLYMLAVLFVLLFFPINVGVLTLLFVAVGDTVAGIVGTLWGKHRINSHVSIEGFLGGFTACFLCTLLFVSAGWLDGFYLAGFSLLLFSTLAGLIGSLSECVLKRFDDNLVIPILSAPSLWLVMKFF